jgi:hypothetical protein
MRVTGNRTRSLRLGRVGAYHPSYARVLITVSVHLFYTTGSGRGLGLGCSRQSLGLCCGEGLGHRGTAIIFFPLYLFNYLSDFNTKYLKKIQNKAKLIQIKFRNSSYSKYYNIISFSLQNNI